MMTTASVHISLRRLQDDLYTLSQIGRDDGGGISRPAFSPPDLKARAWLIEQMESIDLSVHVDPVGNIIGRWWPNAEGDTAQSAILIGSHIDTVPHGGMFDGALGVCAGLECVRTLRSHGYQPHHPIEVIAFADEEGTHGAGTFGSRAMIRGIANAELEVVGTQGFTKAEVMHRAGFDPDQIHQARRPPDIIHAYLELHVEQGPVLDQAKVPIGVATDIAGITRASVTFTGRTGHAGTTPMRHRNDALIQAARFITALPELILQYGDAVVGTIGQISIYPGAVNVIPGRVEHSLDLRAPDQALIDRILEDLSNFLTQEKLNGQIVPTLRKEPVLLSPTLRSLVTDACQVLDISYREMPSGAGHDAMSFAPYVPTGLLFVPSQDGRSHCPNEFTAWADVERGGQVLVETVLRVDTYNFKTEDETRSN